MKPTQKALLALALAAGIVAFNPVLRAAPDDDKLFNELANRGMDELLDRAFDVAKTPPDQRESIKTIASLSRLMTDEHMTPEERQEAIKKVAAAIDHLLAPIQNDPKKLMNLAQILSNSGVDREVLILEYWGDSDVERAKVKPIAEAAVKIYDQAIKAANKQADDLANNIKDANDPAAAKWQEAVNAVGRAQFQKFRLTYALVLSMDKTDPARAKLIDDALNPDTGLPQWDNADSGIQSVVRLLMAKLNLMKEDYDQTNKLLDSLIKNDKTEITPQASDALVFEARCFKVITALVEGKVADADKALTEAKGQTGASIVQNAAVLKLLNYRLLAMKADKAPAGPEKDKANAVAVTELGNLVKQFPDLQKVIFDQLLSRIAASPNYPTLDATSLEALLQKGRQLVIVHKATDTFDADTKHDLQRAEDAAREITARASKGFDKTMVGEAALLQGIFLEFLNQKVQAIDSLLDYVEQYLKDPAAKTEFALDHAQDLIVQLQSQSPVDPNGNKDPEVQRIEERFMKIAIAPPFNRKKFALQYAGLLIRESKWMEAVNYYRMVPDTDPPGAQLRARYGEMFALENEMGENAKLTAADKTAIITRMQDLAKPITELANGIIKGSGSQAEKTYARSTLAQASLTAADIARLEQHDPKRTIELLNNFEDAVQGLPDAKALLNRALFARVQSYMQLGQTNDATKSLVDYLKSAGANEGAATVQDLLLKLNAELDKSRADAETATGAGNAEAAAADQKQVALIAHNRAILSTFLVDWAANNTDPNIRPRAYIYRRFAADTKRLSASLETDPAVRTKLLKDALADYITLKNPENVALYKASLDPANVTDPNAEDLIVDLGIGLVDYDLQDYAGVQKYLDPLISDGKLGEDNDQVWEATYKLLDSLHQLAKAGQPELDIQVQKSLKTLYLVWRDGIGGKKFHNQFEALSKEVMPDWKLGATTQPGH